jgi:hypothetical protein
MEKRLSAVAVGHDFVEFTNTNGTYTFVIVALNPTSATQCYVKLLGGGDVPAEFTSVGTVRWLSSVFYVSDGSHESWGNSTAEKVKGLFYSSGTDNASSTYPPAGGPAQFYGKQNLPAVVWGVHSPVVDSTHQPIYLPEGSLNSDGGVSCTYVQNAVMYRHGAPKIITVDVPDVQPWFDVDANDAYDVTITQADVALMLRTTLGTATVLNMGDEIVVRVTHQNTCTGYWGTPNALRSTTWVDPYYTSVSFTVFWESIADSLLTSKLYTTLGWMDVYTFKCLRVVHDGGFVRVEFAGSVTRSMTW